MEDIYYVDRPSIPATRQNIIHLNSVIEHAVLIEASEIDPSYCAQAVEVRNIEGVVDGTLLYFPGATYAALTAASTAEEAEAEAEVFDGQAFGVSELTGTPQTIDEFNNESTLIDLEIELAEAKRVVQDIEDNIAAIEKESFID